MFGAGRQFSFDVEEPTFRETEVVIKNEIESRFIPVLGNAYGGCVRVEPVNTGGELRLPYADLWRKDDAASVSVGMRNACSAEQQYTGMVDVVIRSGVAGVHIPAMVVVEAEVDPFPSGIKESRTMYLRNEKRVSALVGVLVLIGDGAGEHVITGTVFQRPVRKGEEPVAGGVSDADYRYPVAIGGALVVLVNPFLVVICLLKFIAQSGKDVELSQWQAVVDEAGEHRLFDAVVGIGGEAALEKYVVAVGECLFCAETEFAFPEWGGEQELGGIEVVAYAVARSGVFGSVVFGILTDAVPAVQVVGVEVDVPFAESAVVVSVGCLPPAGVGICLAESVQVVYFFAILQDEGGPCIGSMCIAYVRAGHIAHTE